MVKRGAPFTISREEAQAITGGVWHGSAREVTIHGVSIDSRDVWPGALFACIKGARVDGHDFAATAVGDGAALIIAQRQLDIPVPVLVVDDTETALGQLASEFRRRFTNARWIGVSGANGKTTVKELLAAAMAEDGPTHATSGNRNNHLGVPLTILNTPAETRWAVVELGANKGGEIAELAAMVQPDVGVMTSLGPAHLEGYGDLAGVARGEAAVFAACPAGAPALFGAEGLDAVAAAGGAEEDQLFALIEGAAAGRDFSVVGGWRAPLTGDVSPEGVRFHCGEGAVALPLLGRHNLANASLAWKAAVAAGVNPECAMRGLARVKPVPGRLRLITLGAHRCFDDCYNANPASMAAGLQELSRQPGARLAILGAMGELGGKAATFHRSVGATAASLGLPLLVVGTGLATEISLGYKEAGGRDVSEVMDVRTALEHVQARLEVGPTALLVKASHAAGLSALIDGLQQHFSQQATEAETC